MNTYAQIVNGSQSYFGFLNFKFQDGQMKISVARGVKPATKWTVDLDEISELSTDEYLGAKRIVFFVGNTEYIFLATGVGVTEFLEDNLYEQA